MQTLRSVFLQAIVRDGSSLSLLYYELLLLLLSAYMDVISESCEQILITKEYIINAFSYF